jgi:hypothetical protein
MDRARIPGVVQCTVTYLACLCRRSYSGCVQCLCDADCSNRNRVDNAALHSGLTDSLELPIILAYPGWLTGSLAGWLARSILAT